MGVLLIMRERVKAMSFLLVTKWSLTVYVCVCTHWGGWWKKDRESEGKRERLSPCQSGDWGQTCIIRFTMTRCYYSIFHVLTLSVQTYTQEDSNPTHSAILSNKSTQTSTLILTESETISCLSWEKSHLKLYKHTTNNTALFPFNILLKSSTSRFHLYYITSTHYFHENVFTCLYWFILYVQWGYENVRPLEKMLFWIIKSLPFFSIL